MTIVSGGPGTGKTAVALHRAAYLLYSDRSRYAGGGILVVGPSAVFVEYIASVLPSLGEETATLHSLGSLFPGMDATRTDPPEVAAVKGSLRMRRVLEQAARDAVPGGPGELRLLYRGALLRLDHRELDSIRDRALSRGARRNEARRAGFDGVFAALWAQARRLSIRQLPEQPAFEAEIAERADFREFLKAWWPRLHPRHVLGWLARPDQLRRYAGGSCPGRRSACSPRRTGRWTPKVSRSPTSPCWTSWTRCWASRCSRSGPSGTRSSSPGACGS